MANDFGNTNGLVLGQMVLRNLKKNPVISRISTNFGATVQGQTAKFGQQVDVPLLTAIAAADYDRAAGGYAATDSADTNASVTIDQHKHVTREVTVEEAFSFDEDLLARHAELDANTLVNTMVLALLGLVANPAVPTATQQTVKAVGSMGHDVIVDMNVALDGRDATDMGRFGMFNSAYHGALRKDSTVIDNSVNPQSNTVADGRIVRVDGVDCIKFPTLPANSENLTGLVATADGLAVATILPDLARLAQIRDIPRDAKIEVISDAESGLQMLLIEKLDSQLGTLTRSFVLMYGVGLGNTANIEKLASL